MCACTPHHTQVRITLTETPELKVDACPGCHFTSCLCGNEAKTFMWNVTATRLGEVEQREEGRDLSASVGWSQCSYIDLSAARAQQCALVLPAGKVNVTVSGVAEDSHVLCDNRIAVTPSQGERDTVVKPLLVKVSHTSGWRTPEGSGLSPGTISKMLRGILAPSSWKQKGLLRHGDFPSCFPYLNYSFSICSQEVSCKRRPKTPFSVLQVWDKNP